MGLGVAHSHQGVMTDMDQPPCGLCGRRFTRQELTRHHCRPRAKGGTEKDVGLLCRQCHGMVHATYTNVTLAALYPTLTKLAEAPELKSYLQWVRKQPSSRHNKNRDRKRKL